MFYGALQGMSGRSRQVRDMFPVTSGYIAQWLERLTADQQVPGSNPSVPFCQLVITATIVVIIVSIVIATIITIVSIHHRSSTLIVVLRPRSRRTPMLVHPE
jgi:hypothetical protein